MTMIRLMVADDSEVKGVCTKCVFRSTLPTPGPWWSGVLKVSTLVGGEEIACHSANCDHGNSHRIVKPGRPLPKGTRPVALVAVELASKD